MPHSVVSLQRPGYRPVSTVMLGSHFYNQFSMWPTLVAAITHALWHDVWTNAEHDDRDYSIARMLAWQEMRMRAGAQWPFEGRDLHALVVMGMLPFIFQSLPFSIDAADDASGEEMEVDGTTTDAGKGEKALGKRWLETYNPLATCPDPKNPSDRLLDTVRHDMALLAHSILSRLSSSQTQEFLQVWSDARSIFIMEYER